VNLSEYLTKDRVILIQGQNKAEALLELIDILGRSEAGASPETLRTAVWKREKLMSTGMGQGLAVPHVRLAEVKKTCLAVGVSPEGITDYDSLDNQPVHLIVMIVVPQGDHEVHLRLLAEISRKLKDDNVREKIFHESDTNVIRSLLIGLQ
jgi:PTS system nitrogen regulatory IIA component